MTKSPHAFRSIGEVARLVGVATHVLRYWETQFPALSPVRRADGRRYYRPDDVLLVAGICEMLREEGLTIRGARRQIASDKGAGLRERGRARLRDALGADAGAETVAAATPPDQGAINGAGAETTGTTAPVPWADSPGPNQANGPAQARASSHGEPRAGRSGHDAQPLPLFPELEPSPAAGARNPAAAPLAPGAWLSRLSATAALLRKRNAPLPAGAPDLARALRTAHAACPGARANAPPERSPA